MMDKSKLRGVDFFTSILLILFGVWILFLTFQMPMRDTYGGVINVWYVSPALFPLCIGIGMILLSINILIHSIKEGGFQLFKNLLNERRKFKISEKGYRFAAILIPLVSLVYMNLPRIDFFLSIVLFLLFFTAVFYFDDFSLLKKLLGFYSVEMLALLFLFLTGIAQVLINEFRYTLDIIALVLILALYINTRVLIRGNREYKRKYQHTLFISLVTPLILAPAFRFFLRIPLPYEGGIIELMFLLQYFLR